jgi:amino acid transporter
MQSSNLIPQAQLLTRIKGMTQKVYPASPETADQNARKFVRGLGRFDSTMLVVSAIIGSGIFIVPADMTRHVGSAGWLLVAWGVAGALTIAGALCYGELAAMMPQAGGMYIYLREAYSPLLGSCTAGLSIRSGQFAG